MKIALFKYGVFLMVVLGLTPQIYAYQMNREPSQVSENYYIEPAGVYVAPSGIFVLFDGELVQVNTLCADSRGVFVPHEEMSRRFVWCPICQHWYDADSKYLHRCS